MYAQQALVCLLFGSADHRPAPEGPGGIAYSPPPLVLRPVGQAIQASRVRLSALGITPARERVHPRAGPRRAHHGQATATRPHSAARGGPLECSGTWGASLCAGHDCRSAARFNHTAY